MPVDKRPSEAEQSDTVAYLLGWNPGGSAMRALQPAVRQGESAQGGLAIGGRIRDRGNHRGWLSTPAAALSRRARNDFHAQGARSIPPPTDGCSARNVPYASKPCSNCWSPICTSPYRSVLEHYARHHSASHCAGIHEQTKAYLRATQAGRFDEAGLRNYRSQLPRRDEYKLGTIRGFLKRWHRMGYYGISEDAVAYLSRIRLAKNETGGAVKSLDPDEGPFEDNELRAVIDATVSAFERTEIKLDIFAFMMLLCHTGQRPEQLTLLRTCDIDSKESAPERTSYIVRVPRGKQRGEGPRQSFDDVPVTSHLQMILERQKAEVTKRVEVSLGALPGALGQDLPLFPAWRKLTSVTGAEDLRDQLSNDVLHVRVGTMQGRATKIVVRFARTGEADEDQLPAISLYDRDAGGKSRSGRTRHCRDFGPQGHAKCGDLYGRSPRLRVTAR